MSHHRLTDPRPAGSTRAREDGARAESLPPWNPLVDPRGRGRSEGRGRPPATRKGRSARERAEPCRAAEARGEGWVAPCMRGGAPASRRGRPARERTGPRRRSRPQKAGPSRPESLKTAEASRPPPAGATSAVLLGVVVVLGRVREGCRGWSCAPGWVRVRGRPCPSSPGRPRAGARWYGPVDVLRTFMVLVAGCRSARFRHLMIVL